ncbi:hypothetical protein HO173_001910 [Letharia columbiana]|uniref:DUF1776-domain-containing protein n=1 Tax=Letharia columbiana TaxID=112416 RepID=A0A8H6L937_9LECA|nr:uncharacterized protein HO173_001910 [Letharia columbiana]KAF6240299.1 hypothetical protein HO173_001910 [Letharia columbiana]
MPLEVEESLPSSFTLAKLNSLIFMDSVSLHHHVTSEMSSILESVNSFTEAIDRHFESVGRSLKDAFRDTPWLPDSIKPKPPPVPHRVPVIAIPLGYFEATRIWVSEHRAWTAAVVAFLGTGAFIVWRRKRNDRVKRRAGRAKNGSRTEVVILAGSPYSPLTRSLSLDLERRGFIVYIPVSTLSEEQIVQSESRADIRPLNMDITSPSSTEETVQKFTTHINTPQHPLSNAPPHDLHLTSLVIFPAVTLPVSPVTSLSPPDWSDILNTNLVAPFTTLHAFLPLLVSQKSSLLFLNPSIVPSLTPPSHAAESIIGGALNQYISTLRREVQVQGVNVVHFRLGHFDYGPSLSDNQQLVPSQYSPRAEFARRRLEQKGLEKPAKGQSLRELHNGVFDAMARGKGRNGTIFVGRGARSYELVGRWVPDGIVGWMMGAAKTNIVETAEKEGSVEGSTEWEKVDDGDDR